jgi:hypothetical protein
VSERAYIGHLDMACTAAYDELAAVTAELVETRADRDAYRMLETVAIEAYAELYRRHVR